MGAIITCIMTSQLDLDAEFQKPPLNFRIRITLFLTFYVSTDRPWILFKSRLIRSAGNLTCFISNSLLGKATSATQFRGYILKTEPLDSNRFIIADVRLDKE
jgi:hypothetical protein